MARPPEQSILLLDGAVQLYKRPRSTLWQCRFKLAGVWHYISTKQRNLNDAKSVASDTYLRARFREQEGLPTVLTRTFRSVALATRRDLLSAIETGRGRAVYQDYIEVIDKYLIPYFGAKSISSIAQSEIMAFDKWREDQFGRVPAASTINTHNAALNRVFDTAIERGFMTRSKVPDLKNNGTKGERRPDFTIDEWRTLYRFMRSWVKQGKKGLITQKREILRDYVLFLGATGVRPGTETAGLKWKHIRFAEVKGVEYVAIRVSGKTGSRELVARHGVIAFLQRLHKRNAKVSDIPFRDLIAQGSDEFVFALPDGTEVKNLAAPFKISLQESGLLLDRRTGEQRTLYSIRHFFITQAILGGKVSTAILARNCGTSQAMIEKFYSHVIPLMAAESIAGALR